MIINYPAAVMAIHFIALGSVVGADRSMAVTNPVADYISQHKYDLREKDEKNEHVIKIEIDIDNDGRKDLFLSSTKSGRYDANQYANKVYIWDLYRKLDDGRYALMALKKSETRTSDVEFSQGQSFDFDPEKIYVGYIKEADAFGILSMYFLPKRNEVIFAAYILYDGYFECRNFPDPAKPVEKYHRDDAGNIPDFPDSFKHYFAKPPAEKVEVIH